MLDKIKNAGGRILHSIKGALVRYLDERWGALADAIADAIILIRARREEDISVSYVGIAGCLIAGIIMAVAKPLVAYITGIDLDHNTIVVGNQTQPLNLPSNVSQMMNKLLLLVMYLGVVLVVIGLIWAGISLRRRLKDRLSYNS